MRVLEAVLRHTECSRSARIRVLLTGVSVVAVLAGSASRAAGEEPRGLWNPAAAAAAAAAAVSAGAQQGAATAAQAQQSMTAATNTIRGMWNAQDAARAAAAALSSSNAIVNGLGKGTSSQIPGLVVDPRVPKDLAHPKAGENTNLWLNANLPTQTTSGGQTIVNIRQTAPQAVMTWEYFNVGPSTTLVFDQQGHASWVALNRIDATGLPSQIQGSIKADGTVLLINPNGIVFGGQSQVNLGSLIASALDIDSSPAATVFNNGPAYTPLTLADGVKVAVPPNEDAANRAFLQSGLFSVTDSAKTRGAVLFDLGDQSLGTKGGGAISVQAGASIRTNVSANGDGGYVALLGTSVTNAGGISSPGGQIVLGAGNVVQLTDPSATTTGVDRKITVSLLADLNLAEVIQSNLEPPSLDAKGRVTNAADGILSATNGAVTLAGDHIDQLGGISVTTSVTRPGSVVLDTSHVSTGADGDIVLGPGSLVAILPDESSGTIPAATATADYFKSTLQPQISVTAVGNIAMRADARIKAPSAKVTMNAGSGSGTGTVLLESGSSIDLSGLTGVTLPMSINEVSILLTAAELANTPLAKNLIGTTVTIDARLSGTRADGIQWVGSPLLEASGYVGLIPRTIHEILTVGGIFSATAPQNFIQQPGAVIDISGGSVTYEGGKINTTRLQGADGRVYDIGTADPIIAYIGVAGQFVVDHPHWGVTEIFTDPLRNQGHFEPGYVAGASAGGITVQAATPVLAGTIIGDIMTGIRQRALAQGGGTARQTSFDQLPAGASLSVAFGSAIPIPYKAVLEPRDVAGPDPYGLAGFSLDTASTWAPTLVDKTFPIFSDRLSATGFGSIHLTGDVVTTLSMTAGASLSVRPGGSITLDNVTAIYGTLKAPGGRIALNGNTNPVGGDLIIGSSAVLDARGLWVNDRGLSGDAFQGAAFINGGSVSIGTAAASASTTKSITSGTLADGTNVAGLELLEVRDTTQSIVLVPGSVIDVSSGGYIGANGRFKVASDGLPAGKGGSVTLQTYINGNTDEAAPKGHVGLNRYLPSGTTTAEDPIVLFDGTVLPPGNQVYLIDPIFPFDPPSGTFPTDGRLRANVVLGGTIHAEGFDGGGTFSLTAPSIKIGGTGPVASYIAAERLAAIVADTGLPAASFTHAGARNLGTVGAETSVSAARAGEIEIPASFFADNAFGAYVLTSAVGDVTVVSNTTLDLRQANLLAGAAPGTGADLNQRSGAIPRLFESFGRVADGLRKPVDLTLVDPNGLAGILVDKGAEIAADPKASGPASISLVLTPAVDVLGKITARSGEINLVGDNVWVGREAVLDVSSMFVPDPRVTTYATGRLVDAGTITLAGGTVVVDAGARLRLEGGAETVQVQDLSASSRQRFVDSPIWSNGGSLRIAGNNLYFAGSVSAAGGAPLASGGTLTIGNIPVPSAVASYVIGVEVTSGSTLEGNLAGPATIVLQPDGNVAASLVAAHQASGTTASYPVTPADFAALTPSETAPGGFIGVDTLSKSSFDSIGLFTGTIAFNGSVKVSVPGALTLAADSGSFVALPASPKGALLPSGVTLSGPGQYNFADQGSYTIPAGALGIPGIGGATVTLDAGYLRFVGTQGPILGGAQATPPLVADGRLNVNAKWIDLERVISISNVVDASFTSSGAIRLLPEIFGQGTIDNTLPAQASFGGALATAGNLTLAAAVIYPVSGTQFLLASTGTLPGIDDTITIRQNGIAAAPLSAGGAIVLDAERIVHAGTLWAPLGSITIGLSDPFSQIPAGIMNVLLDPSGFSVVTQSVSLEPGSLTSVSAAGLDLPYGYTIDRANWSVGTLSNSGNPDLPAVATLITAPPAKSISSFGADIRTKAGAVIDASGGGDVYATEFVSGTGGTRNVLTTAANGESVFALVPSSTAAVAAYDPTFTAGYNSDGSSTAPGTAISIADGGDLPAGTYVLLPGMYATLPGAYRVVRVAESVNYTGPERVTATDGSAFVKGTVTNALTGTRASQSSLFQLQSNANWTKYSKIEITAGTSYFRDLAKASDAVIPPLPIDGGLLALGATKSLSLESTNRFDAGTSNLAPGLRGGGGQVDISAANILILAADRQAPKQDPNAVTPYLVLDADQISRLGAASVRIGGTTRLADPGTIVPTATSVEVETDESHPLTGPEIILVAIGSAEGKGITVDVGSVIRAKGTVTAETNRDIHIGSTLDGSSGDGALLRISNGEPVQIIRDNLFDPRMGRIAIGTTPGTADLPIIPGAAVTIDGGNALTLDSSNSTILAANTVLTAHNYDMAADVINIGGGNVGLSLTGATIAKFAGAQSVTLRSASVFNFYDANGLVVGDASKPIGTLTFNGGGFFSEGGTTIINARDVVLTNTQLFPNTNGSIGDSDGTLRVDASGAVTLSGGTFTLTGSSDIRFDAREAIRFSGTGSLDAQAAHLVLAAPVLLVDAGAAQAVTTSGTLEILRGLGTPMANAATNIGGALTLTGGRIDDAGTIEALSGNVTLNATNGDITLAAGAAIVATGSQFPVLDQVLASPGGKVKLVAADGNVTIGNGARIDISAAGTGYSGSLAIETGPNGVATIEGLLLGAAAYDDIGGDFTLNAGKLSGSLPFSGGFTDRFAVALQSGDIEIEAGDRLTSSEVLLSTELGSVIVDGTIDAKGPRGGSISLYGSHAVSINAGAQLIARYQAVGADDPGYAAGTSAIVQTGGTIILGTTGTPDGSYNPTYGYENVTSSGTITVASGAVLDVSGGTGGRDVANTGGQVILRAPILANGHVNVAFHGTLVTNSEIGGKPSGKGVALDAYAVWSTADTAFGGTRHFDGVIDPAGWYDSHGGLVPGAFADVSGATVATWDGIALTSFDGASDQPAYYLTNSYFVPSAAHSDHVGFYQQTLVEFIQHFGAVADFSGARLRVGSAPEIGLPSALQPTRPEISLVNPSTDFNGGDIAVVTNWNLGAGAFDGAGNYRPYYRTAAGEAGSLSLRAVGNLAINATVSDGFYEATDAFGGSEFVANLIANHPRLAGNDPHPVTGLPIFDFNTTSAASLMSVVPGINNGSFSYDFVAGAAFHADGVLSVDPHAVVSVAEGSGTGNVTIDGHTTYANPLNNNPFINANAPSSTISIPTLLRTGTGSISIAAAGNVTALDQVAPGAIYTAGAKQATPAGFVAPAISVDYQLFSNGLVSTPTWASGGGNVTITAGQSIVGVAPSVVDPNTGVFAGQDWNLWYYHSGLSSGTSTPFSGSHTGTTCGPATVSCQTAAWVNYATFKGFGALGGGNIGLIAGADITNVSASLPESVAVSNGLTPSSPPVAQYFGGGNLRVQAGGNLYSGTFLVGRGAGLIEASGAITADPTFSPITGLPGIPLLLAVQDGFITAIARGPVTLGTVYDPASLPTSYDSQNAVGGATPILFLPNGAYVDSNGVLQELNPSTWGSLFTSYGAGSGIALRSTAGDITALGNGDTGLVPGGFAAIGRLLPSTLSMVAYTGDISINSINGDSNLVPYPTEAGSSNGTITLVAAHSIDTGTLTMPDLDTRNTQYLGSPTASGDNYISPLGVPLANLTLALHANDPAPAIIVAGKDINGSIQLIKPADIVAGHDIALSFIGQNNVSSDITRIVAGNDIPGPGPGGLGSSFYIYGPGTLLLEAGHDIGPLRLSIGNLTSGVAAVGDGSNIGGALAISPTFAFSSIPIRPYLPRQSADIAVRFGVGPGTDYQAAISRFVDPAQAGVGGIDFLADIAVVLGESRGQAWTTFQSLSPARQYLLVDRAFLDFLTQVATDYRNSASPYFAQYGRAYEAIRTLFPVALGYTDNGGSGSGNGAATRVSTGDLNIAQSVIETQIGGDINIIGPGGGITVGSTSRDLLKPSQEGILTLAGGTIRSYTDGSVLVNQSRILTLQGGDINLFTANGDISAGEGPKTYVSNPPVSSICDINGFCQVNPSGLVTGAGIGALVTLPGQDATKSNVTLVAPVGTVDAGAAGVRVSGNLNIVALQVLNAYNIQVQGTTTGVSVQTSPNIGALTAASNAAGSTQASVASTAARTATSDISSVIIVEVIGYGGSDESRSREP